MNLNIPTELSPFLFHKIVGKNRFADTHDNDHIFPNLSEDPKRVSMGSKLVAHGQEGALVLDRHPGPPYRRFGTQPLRPVLGHERRALSLEP